MRVLVTGGAGFIGSHSVGRLLSAGHEVLVVDDLSTGNEENLAAVQGAIRFERLDIRDGARLRQLFTAWKPEAVLHLAAVASISRSLAAPLETASVNLDGSLQILEAARTAGVRRLVFASSASVYGSTPRLPSTETDRPEPASPYAAQKLAVESHLAAYQGAYGIQATALRYFNVYGPRQLPQSDYSGVITILANALRRHEVFQVYGDGHQTRDYIAVSDVAEINGRAVEGLATDESLLNAGSGRSTSLLELIQACASIMETEPLLQFLPPRPGDVRYSQADIGRLCRASPAFHPRPLPEGLAALLADCGA
ncbi:MAG: NAD-dependent epimerase/dehydratase family protein [Dehalococcoidia bacterium]